MKSLTVSALLFAGFTGTAGCDPEDTAGDNTGDVRVSWALKSSDGSGNVIETPCPAGGDTIQIISRRGDDAPFIGTFFCNEDSGVADRLPAGEYSVWIQLTDTTGAVKFAESAVHPVTVAVGAITPLGIDLFTDRAFFQATWNLQTSGGAPTSCAAASVTGVSIRATVTGGTDFFDYEAPCADGESGVQAFTQTPVPIGETYTVAVTAVDSTGTSLGDAPALPDRVLDVGNEFEDLGTVVITIAP